MTCLRLIVMILTLVVSGDPVAIADNRPSANPLEGNPSAVRAGMGGFRQRCADCHGIDARGVRGPDLTQVWASGRTDQGLFHTIRSGIPGTEMPSFPPIRTSDSQIWEILTYLHTLAVTAPQAPARGNAEHGKEVFRINCAVCHRVGTVGGRLAPDLSRVGVARSRDAIVTRIRHGSEDFLSGFEPVTLIPTSGPPIFGLKKNEDLFSIQIMDTGERIQGFAKDKMKAVLHNTRSLMPIFDSDRLSESDLNDLLQYLQTLRGFDPAVHE